MKKYIYCAIFNLGVLVRNKSLWNSFKELKRTEKKSYIELQTLQNEKLKELLCFLKKYNPYYRHLIANNEIDLSSINVDTLSQLPSITKDELILYNSSLHSVFKFNKVFKCETSGTSGQVLKFNKNEKWDSFTRASMMRGYSWFGINPWDFNIYFWGYNTKCFSKIKLRILDKLVNRWRIFNFDKKSISTLEHKIKNSVFIEGYSSMIYELSKMVVTKDFNAANLKMIKGTSEKIFPHYQKSVHEAFGMKMISEYGAAETGIIAFECPEGNMHINMEGVIVEVNERNEILVTNLYSYSFPIIRYKLGDVVSLANINETCKCGLHHPILNEVTGRIGKSIHGFTRNFPSLTLYYIFKNIYFNNNIEINYQAHQNSKGNLDIWLDVEISEFLSNLIKHEAFKYFEQEIEIKLTFSNRFREVEGKLRDFITTLE